MKKIIATILTLIIVLVFCGGCGAVDEDYEKAIKDDVYATYENMKSDLGNTPTTKAISAWLNTWANSNKLFSKSINDNGIVMEKEATDDYKKSESVTLQCNMNENNIKDFYQTAAIALTALSDTENHGKLTLIFINGKKGAMNIPDKYLDTDNFINLTPCLQTSLYTGSAGTAEYQISKKMNYKSTTSSKAYKITISNCTGGDSSDRTKKHPNPIVTIGTLLNDCRRSNIIFDLSAFNGGENASTYPTYATATIVVNSNYEDKLVNKLKNAKDEYTNKYLKSESNMKYKITSVSVPSKVFTEEDTDSIMSLMYTLEDGVYKTSEKNGKGDILALSTIGRISTKNNELKINIFGRSLDSDVMKEMNKAFADTASLSDASFKILSSSTIWPSDSDNKLAKSFIVAASQIDVSLKENSTFKENESAIFYSKNEKLNIISLGVNIQDGLSATESIILFIKSLGTSKTTL